MLDSVSTISQIAVVLSKEYGVRKDSPRTVNRRDDRIWCIISDIVYPKKRILKLFQPI
jgi:hypothetical protein